MLAVDNTPLAFPSSCQESPMEVLSELLSDCAVIDRLDDTRALSLLAELAHALSSLKDAKRQQLTVPFYTGSESWELGIEADGYHALLSALRLTPTPLIAPHNHSVEYAHLGSRLQAILLAAVGSNFGIPNPTLLSALEAIEAWRPASPTEPCRRVKTTVTTSPVEGLQFEAEGHFRAEANKQPCSTESQCEKADLLSLLTLGRFEIRHSEQYIPISQAHLFLLTEGLLQIAQKLHDASKGERPLYHELDLNTTRLEVTYKPVSGGVSLAISVPDSPTQVVKALTTRALIQSSVELALGIVQAFVTHDPAQQRNIRLHSLKSAAQDLQESSVEALCDDALTNPSPDDYRRFRAPEPTKPLDGRWAHGGTMGFDERWTATISGIDLRSVFLHRNSLLLSSTRETACLDKDSGRVSWKIRTPYSVKMVTPAGLARFSPSGDIHIHDFNDGQVLHRFRIKPRSAGGIAGALVNSPALPKLLVLADGDRNITALDLVSGTVRWRHTVKSSAEYRIRQAGRLLLVSGGDTALVALDVLSGEVVWRRRDRLPFSGDTVIHGDSVFAVCRAPDARHGRLHHLDVWSGAAHWTMELASRRGRHRYAMPLATRHVLVVPHRGMQGTGATAYDQRDGKILWRYEAESPHSRASWLALDSSVLLNTDNGQLIALDDRTGHTQYELSLKGRDDMDQPRSLDPVLQGGVLFVPQQQVHVVRPTTGESIGTVPTDLVPDRLCIDEHGNPYLIEESGHLAAFRATAKLQAV